MFFIQKSRDGPGDPRLSARIRGGVTKEPDAKAVAVSSSMEPVTTQMSRWLASGGCTLGRGSALSRLGAELELRRSGSSLGTGMTLRDGMGRERWGFRMGNT